MSSKEVLLTRDTASEIEDPGERTFAQAVTSKGHLTVTYGIPVRGMVIDFRVKNERLNGDTAGKLVEVTNSPKTRKLDRRKFGEEEDKRRKRQVKAMKDNGQPFTILYDKNLEKIQQNLDD